MPTMRRGTGVATQVGRPELSIERVAVREESLRDALADDHDALAVVMVAIREFATGEQRNAEQPKEAGPDEPLPRERVLLAVGR